MNLIFEVTKPEDFQRDIIRSPFCTLSIPHLELELPTNKKGSINTLEGFLTNVKEDLE